MRGIKMRFLGTVLVFWLAGFAFSKTGQQYVPGRLILQLTPELEVTLTKGEYSFGNAQLDSAFAELDIKKARFIIPTRRQRPELAQAFYRFRNLVRIDIASDKGHLSIKELAHR